MTLEAQQKLLHLGDVEVQTVIGQLTRQHIEKDDIINRQKYRLKYQSDIIQTLKEKVERMERTTHLK